MGHIRLGRLPATKRWQQVVALLSERRLRRADCWLPAQRLPKTHSSAPEMIPAVRQSFWLLTQIPLAARAPDFSGELAAA